MNGSAELRERVIEIITKAIAFDGDPERATRDVLAALGLDDVDAAVERYHDGTRRFAAEHHRGWTRDADEAVRAGLEAALTPPGTSSP